jgi:hypothetical protein
MVSDTMDISRLGVLIALSIRIANMENVLEAEVPP